MPSSTAIDSSSSKSNSGPSWSDQIAQLMQASKQDPSASPDPMPSTSPDPQPSSSPPPQNKNDDQNNKNQPPQQSQPQMPPGNGGGDRAEKTKQAQDLGNLMKKEGEWMQGKQNDEKNPENSEEAGKQKDAGGKAGEENGANLEDLGG
jgi:hypothetical protein